MYKHMEFKNEEIGRDLTRLTEDNELKDKLNKMIKMIKLRLYAEVLVPFAFSIYPVRSNFFVHF